MGERLNEERTREMIRSVDNHRRGYLDQIRQKVRGMDGRGSLEDVQTAEEIEGLVRADRDLWVFKRALLVTLGELPPTLRVGGRQLRFDEGRDVNQGGQNG